MAHRVERVAHIIRDVVSDAIANRLNDPRVCRLTSVTRVELSSDMRVAHIHVSVMGTEAEAATTMKGLTSARGLVQTRLAKRLDLRQCPAIQFHLDKGLKMAIQTIRQIDENAREAASRSAPASGDGVDDVEPAEEAAGDLP